MTELKLKQIKNGIILEVLDYNEIEDKEVWETFVFEFQDSNDIEEHLFQKQKTKKIKEMYQFINDRLGYDSVHRNEYYIEFQLKQKKE